jgi:hypothetical protein
MFEKVWVRAFQRPTSYILGSAQPVMRQSKARVKIEADVGKERVLREQRLRRSILWF